jgi:dTDP-4-amino-4,6-dideoxygalactose transaminase
MKIYPLFKVHVPTEEALINIREVFESGFVNEGKQVSLLTEKLQGLLKTSKLILTCNCTSSIVLALRLAGIKQGDEVISTPMTCVATNAAIASSGAKIVWSDISKYDGMLLSNKVEKKITTKTKAVVAVAWAGLPPVELHFLKQLCDSYGLKLILDAAHAFNAEFSGAKVHEYAHYTCYSFQAIKHFSTGDGGALVCLDENDYNVNVV